MPRKVARATMQHYDDLGRRTKASSRLAMRLCDGEKPQIFQIELRDKRTTRFTAIWISRSEIERVLDANP